MWGENERKSPPLIHPATPQTFDLINYFSFIYTICLAIIRLGI